MAKVQYGPLVTGVRGSIAGTTFSVNPSGNYAKSKMSGVNPKSFKQGYSRGGLGSAARAWRGLDDTDRAAWNTAAPNYPHYDKFGNLSPLSGFQAFTMINNTFLFNSLSTTDTPPVWSPLTVPTIVSMIAVVSTPSLAIDMSGSVPAGCQMNVYATPPLSQGRMSGTNAYRFIRSFPAGSVHGQDFYAEYIALFGNCFFADLKIFVKIEYIETTTAQRALAGYTQGIITA